MHSDLLHRLATQRAACKHWCALLATAVLLAGAIAKLPLSSLLWAAAPILLLGLVDASYAAREAHYAEAMARRRGDGREEDAETRRRGDGETLPPETAGESLVRTVVAAMSPGIWPFYLGLFAVVGFGAVSMNPSPRPVVVAARSGGCGSGGCGSAGGCGTSGCGASSGKACGCGSGSATTAQSRTTQPTFRPVTMPVTPRPGFVPVSAVQANRPVSIPQPAAIAPQPSRPAVQASVPAPASAPTVPSAATSARPPSVAPNPAPSVPTPPATAPPSPPTASPPQKPRN